MTLARARIIQYIGILLSLGLIAVGYWYFSVRAGVKTNTSASQSQGTGRLDAGLAGYWKLDENTGTSAADASTNLSSGTLTGGPTWTTGQIGSGVNFDGTNDYITDPGATAVDIRDSLSLATWVKFDTLPSSGQKTTLIRNMVAGNHLYEMKLFNNAGPYQLQFIPGGGGDQSSSAVVSVSTGVWYHMAISFDVRKDTVSLYFNGALVGSQTETVTGGYAGGTGTLYFGAEDGASSFLDGQMDEIRVYDRALSSDEMSALYRLAAPTGVDTSLKGYWSFEGQDISGATAYDRSGAGNTGTLTNGPTVGRGQVGQALSFDGTDDYVLAPTSSSLNITGAISLSTWLKTSDTDSCLVSKSTSVPEGCFGLSGSKVYELGILSNTLYFQVGDGTSVGLVSGSAASVTDNRWHQVTATWDGTTGSNGLTLYVDGIRVYQATSAVSSIQNPGGEFLISGKGGAYDFAGLIDEVRVYNRALSAAEVKAQYDAATPDRMNSSSSQAQGMGRLDSGLRGYWKLDETTGSSAADASTNGNTGTLTNMESGDWVGSQIGNGLDFDGVDEYVTLGSPTALDDVNLITICAWVNPDTIGNDPRIYAKADSSGLNGTGINLTQTTNTFEFRRGWSGAPAARWNTASNSVVTGTWQHLCVTYDNSSTANDPAMYINGVLQSGVTEVSSPSGSPTSDASYDAIIGNRSDAARPFDGKIDELRIYDRLLSADEVGQLYRLTSPTSVDTSLKGYWAFEGASISGTTAFDRSGAGNNGTLTLGPTVGRGRVGQTLVFDGINDYVNVTSMSSAMFANTTFTVTGWFKTSSATQQVIISQDICDGGWNIGIASAANFSVSLRANGSCGAAGASRTSTTPSMIDGVWHHFATVITTNTVTAGSNNIDIYIDGVLNQGSLTTAGVYGTAGNSAIQIGGRYSGTSDPFFGSIDEVRIYTRALSATEIKAQYDSAAPDKLNTSASTPQGAGRLDSGLTGYWRLDENTGASAADASTGGNTGTISGPTWTTGRIGSALSFDGVNDYVAMGDIDVMDGGKQLTAAAWIKQNGATNERHVLDKGDCLGSGSWELMVISGEADFYMPGLNHAVATGTNVSDNQWHHIAATYDGVTQRIYVDGKLAGTTASAGSINSSSSAVEIGGNCNGAGSCGGSCFWNGQIDETRVYNRTLSADEIAQLYNVTAPTGTDTGLEGYWSFNGPDVSGTTAYDRSGSGRNGTLTNGPVVARGKLGQALSFDGTDDYVTAGDISSMDGLTAVTASIWLKTSAYSSEGGLITKSPCTGSLNSGVFELTGGYFGNGIVHATLYKNGGGPDYYQIVGTGSVADGAWHHAAMTYDGSTLRLYIDGVENTSTSAPSVTMPSTANAVTVGNCDGGGSSFPGLLDEARIYNRALSASEIQALYNSGK